MPPGLKTSRMPKETTSKAVYRKGPLWQERVHPWSLREVRSRLSKPKVRCQGAILLKCFIGKLHVNFR